MSLTLNKGQTLSLNKDAGFPEEFIIGLGWDTNRTDTGQELLRYDLTEEFSQETAVIFAEIYRYNGGWKMKAVGAGYKGGFSTLLAQYGLNIPEETDE